MGKTKPHMVGAKTIRSLLKLTKREGAEKSVERAIKFGRIIEKNGKLYCIDLNTRKIEK